MPREKHRMRHRDTERDIHAQRYIEIETYRDRDLQRE